MKCEANLPMCLWLQFFKNGTLLQHYDEDQAQRYAQHMNVLDPRYYSDVGISSSVYVPIIVVIIIVKLIIAILLIHRCLKRRARREQLDRERQQYMSVLPTARPPPPYESRPRATEHKESGQCPGPHYPGGTCLKCGATGITVPRIPTTQARPVPIPSQCARQHVAGTLCPDCGVTATSERPGVSTTETPADRGSSATKPRCHKIHLPWKKCAKCHVDPPRDGHIELESASLPPGPHEMQAHVPAWQGQPEQRAANYGGFYGPRPAAEQPQVRRATANPNVVFVQQNNPAAPGAIARPVTTVPVSPLQRQTLVVGDGHKSYVSYQAASGQPPMHSRTRSVSPIAEDRVPLTHVGAGGLAVEPGNVSPRRSEGDVSRGEREGAVESGGVVTGEHKRSKSSDGLLSSYVGS